MAQCVAEPDEVNQERREDNTAMSSPLLIVLAFLDESLVPHLSVTLAAVHGSPFSRLKGHFGLFAASGTNGGMHFPPPITVAIPATLRTAALVFLSLSALRTTLGFISETLGGKELLLGSAESETCATLYAFEGLVHIIHG